MSSSELPVPAHFDSDKVAEIWRVPYQQRAQEAEQWAARHGLKPACEDLRRVALLLVDVQNTFCTPGFELFVAGRSGQAAVEDNRRLCEFIYRNLGAITHISATQDTHQAMQIFHAICLVDEQGNHPDPLTVVTVDDVRGGRWRFNPAVAPSMGISADYGQRHLEHYAAELQRREKYDLMIWPYHGILGGIGHALVSAVEEAVFFHSIARMSQAHFEVKGRNPLTEHYSVLGPEVTTGPDGEAIAEKNDAFIDMLEHYDAVAITGQAKSHCVAWTIDDLLGQLQARDEGLAHKVHLIEDCTSPVVVPGAVDYTDAADAAFQRFADAGMHVVQSTDPIDQWPGLS